MAKNVERFEMRLDTGMLERIDGWREQQRDLPSRADSVRRLVEFGLQSSQRGREFVLSKSERLIVYMLSELIEKITPDTQEKKKMSLIRDAIASGHMWALDDEYEYIIHDQTSSRQDKAFVIDVLDMWSFIEEGYSALSQDEKNRIAAEVEFFGRDPKFVGFDQRDEKEHYYITDFLIHKKGLFERFRNRELNSHSAKLVRYTKMYRAFEEIRKLVVGRKLSAGEITKILNAGVR